MGLTVDAKIMPHNAETELFVGNEMVTGRAM